MSKTFTSKTATHLQSYTYINKLLGYLFAIKLVSAAYDQFLLPVWAFINVHIISSVPFIYSNTVAVDSYVEKKVLTEALDTYVIAYPVEKLKEVDAKFLKPTNDYVYNSVVNKYLPKAEYKFDESISQLNKSFIIINELLLRLKAKVSNTSTEISNDIISTYNDEIKQLTKNETVNLKGNITASLNTASKSFTKLNESYIQPIKTQTQGYVSEVASQTRSKADSLISDAKQTLAQANKTSTTAATDITDKASELLNGTSSTISASA